MQNMRQQARQCDLTNYSDQELSLTVFNVESLYNIKHNREYLFRVLEESYSYTGEQMEQLIVDLDEDQDDE